MAPHLWLELNGGLLEHESERAAFERLSEPSQQWCDASGARPGQDNATHHLAPRGPYRERELVCSACLRKERDLRIAGQGFARIAREDRA